MNIRGNYLFHSPSKTHRRWLVTQSRSGVTTTKIISAVTRPSLLTTVDYFVAVTVGDQRNQKRCQFTTMSRLQWKAKQNPIPTYK